MENEDLKYPMGGSNRINKSYNNPYGPAYNGQNKKFNFNQNVKNTLMNEQQLFNSFQSGFLRNATNLDLGNTYMNSDEQENELLPLVLKTPDQSKDLLNIFIKDFFDKSGMSKTAEIFESEQGEIKQDYDFLIDIERNSIKSALEMKTSFLDEWWLIFWDAFNAKAHKNGSKIAQEYYSFNISRKNLDFLCRQASMKAAFEQQILERKGEYQREAYKQQAGNPLGFNPLFGAGSDGFPSGYPSQKTNENKYSPLKHESFDSLAFNNAEVLSKIKEQQQILQQQNRQGYFYNGAHESPAMKNEASYVDDENMNAEGGHDMGEYGGISSVPRTNNVGIAHKPRASGQTQQMVQQRLNKITPLVKPHEFSTGNGINPQSTNDNTPVTHQGNFYQNPGNIVSPHGNTGLRNIPDDVLMPGSGNNGLASYLAAYDEQLISMEQRLTNNRMNKNGSSANQGSLG